MSYPPITVTFLGTGTSGGVPMIACDCEVCTSHDPHDNRLRSSILIQSQTTTLVVDTTPDFRTQMLRAGVKKLDAVLYTHPHKDHVAGLDDIKAYNYFQQAPMNVFANTMTQNALLREFPYIFEKEKYPGVPSVHLHTIDESAPFIVGDLVVQPILVYHLHMPVLAFRFGKFTYITDANRIDEAEQRKIIGSNTIVINALRKQPHVSHFTLGQAIQMVENLEIPNAWLTHISHQLGLSAVISEELPANIHLAYDGLKLHFC